MKDNNFIITSIDAVDEISDGQQELKGYTGEICLILFNG